MGWALAGRVALVTGAARGIGAETARELAQRGMRVALVGLEPEGLERAARACGDGAIWLEADVTDLAAVEAAADEVARRLGGIDALVANAGILAPGFVRSIEPDAWQRVVEVNLLGTFRTVRACLPHLIERRGYVLAVSSRAAAFHSPGMSAYAASKAGIEALANSLRAELAHLGVDVGCAYFSLVETDMAAGSDENPLTALLQSRLRGPLARRYPAEQAAAGLVRAVERRERRVLVPGWLRVPMAARTLLPRFIERAAADAMPEADALAERMAAEGRVGELSRPLGAGGSADLEARAAP